MKLSRILGAVALVLAIALIAAGIAGNTFRNGDHALAEEYRNAVAHEASIQKHADSAQKTAPSAVKKAETAVKQTDAAVKEAAETLEKVTALYEGYKAGKINEEVIDSLMGASASIEADLEALSVFSEALQENADKYLALLDAIKGAKTNVEDTAYLLVSGVEKNIGKALEFWEKAAKLGHPSAAEKRSAVYEEVQTKRKKHRAQNHICHDIGFQMPMGNKITAEVTLNRSAFVYLVNQQSYQNYLAGKEYSHSGGYASTSPYTIDIKSANHWYIIVDNGNESIEGIVSEVKVKTN